MTLYVQNNYPAGTESICKLCGKKIKFTGKVWYHIDYNPRHIAIPETKIMKRQFLMLAHDYDPKKHSILGWYMSEKLDGLRAWWDGGITPAARLIASLKGLDIEEIRRKLT